MTLPTETYRRPARVLHWAMALLIILTIPVGLLMVQDGLSRSLQNGLYIFHKNVGVLLLILVAVRLIYRLRRTPPSLPDSMPDSQKRIANLTHLALYALLVIMPLSGYTRVKAGGFPIESLDALGVPSLVPRSDALAEAAQNVHYFAGLAIGGLIALHIGAALFHLLIRKDGVFSRMWPPSRQSDA